MATTQSDRKPALHDLKKSPMIVAHRGSSGTAPENTMAAFTQALDVGVSMIELDVQLSKDNRVVVIHDATVDRTTDGSGKVAAYDANALRKLDAGSWFDEKFRGERIPLLEDALELIAPKALVNIEIKSSRIIRTADTKIIDATLNIVRDMGLIDRVLFSSFNHKLMKYLKEKEPGAHTGVIFHPVMHFGRMPSALAHPAGAGVFVCSKKEVTRKRIKDAEKHNIIIGVYGVDRAEDVKEMLAQGITVLVSDYPAMLVQHINKYEIHKAS